MCSSASSTEDLQELESQIRSQESRRVRTEFSRMLLPLADILQEMLNKCRDGDGHLVVNSLTVGTLVEMMQAVLCEEGVCRYAPSCGEEYNQEMHDAVEIILSEEVSEGHVVTTVQDGYEIDRSCLRKARVVISNGAQIAPENTDA